MPENDTATVFGETMDVPGLSDWLSDIDNQGFAVISNWINAQRVAELGADLRREINPIRELMPPDQNHGSGSQSSRKTRCVEDLVCDPRLVARVHGVLGQYIQISVVAMFDLIPGARAQGLHQDDGLWPLPRPHPPFVVNAVIAVDEFTKENGATVLVSGSHKWHDEPVRQPPDVDTIQVEMAPGTMLIWTGALWHGGGANTTSSSRLAIDINFNLSFLRQQENQYIGIPREELPKMPEHLRRLIGYQHGLSAVGPGMVDLRDPLKMVDEVTFGNNVNEDRFPPIG